jgi:DNA polymerase-4
VEPLSLDEAYLDVSENKLGYQSAIYMARLIKEAIREETGLTATAGVSYNKFLAKMASDYRKPDGLNYIGPEAAASFLEKLPVGKFHGIGAKTAEKMGQLGLHTGADLKTWERQNLVNHFGKAGHFYFDIVRGIDQREVQPHRPMKSVSIEDTFGEDQIEMPVLLASLSDLNERLFRRLERKSTYGKTVTLKVKYGDFTQITRSKTAESFLQSPAECLPLILDLLSKTEAGTRPTRLLGIGISNFPGEDDLSETAQSTLTLF